jgi:phosphohistidine swiveling domain-containing protein
MINPKNKKPVMKLTPKNWQAAFKWQYEAYPIFTSVYLSAAQTKEKNKYYTDWADFLNNFKNGHLIALKPSKQTLKVGNTAIKESLAGNNNYYRELKKVHQEINTAISSCLAASLKKDALLSSWWPKTQTALSHTANILFAFDYTFDDFLKKLHKNNPKDFKIINHHIRNKKLSFMDEAAQRLLELDKKYNKNFNKVFETFIKEFGWFQNTYKGVFKINKKWLLKYLKEIKNKKTNSKPEKEKIAALPKKYKIISQLANETIGLRDDKKKLLLLAVALMDNWAKLECRKNKWSFEIIRWLTMNEIIEIIASGKGKNLKKAKEYHNKNQRLGLMTHNGYQDVDESFWDKAIKFYDSNNTITKITGVIASRGIYQGIIKIIIDAKKEAKKFNQGDILVTSMTRPEFLPLMSRAGAFITDEGGISCHAAIVAREMNKPCIIATKNATRILKDGDLVRIDANKGIIEKINN